MRAYKHKGMKAPRPGAYGLDESKAAKEAPKTKPSMQHKEPAHEMKPEMASQAPQHKKAALPSKDAPEGVKGVNEGKEHQLPKSGLPGESEV